MLENWNIEENIWELDLNFGHFMVVGEQMIFIGERPSNGKSVSGTGDD